MTSSPIAYRNGEFVSLDKLTAPPQDLGFMWGVTVAEQLRTFRGELFQLAEHLNRLRTSLQIVGVDVDITAIEDAAKQIVKHNYATTIPYLGFVPCFESTVCQTLTGRIRFS